MTQNSAAIAVLYGIAIGMTQEYGVVWECLAQLKMQYVWVVQFYIVLLKNWLELKNAVGSAWNVAQLGLNSRLGLYHTNLHN